MIAERAGRHKRKEKGRWETEIAYSALLAVVAGVLIPAASAAALPQYVALGDSYSSGVGTRVFYEESGECDRLARTPTGRRSRRRQGLRAELPGVQRGDHHGSERKTARHAEQQHQPRHDHDRWQRRGLQQRNHQLRPLLLHLRRERSPNRRNSSEKNSRVCWKRPTKTSTKKRPPPKLSCWVTRSCSPKKGRPATSIS